MLASGGDPPLRRRPFTPDVCAHVTWYARAPSRLIIFDDFYHDNYIMVAKIKKEKDL